MSLDWRVCSRARLARDARFDGKFFIAVLTTKIYCRPICPARTCKESNVRYFLTAAAAAENGFRPCMRCRPESSPGTAAWAGTRNTVSRALQLIGESGLEGGGVERLAERLGVGARHLRRLFLRHLGATPSAVAHTRRLHFAKKLIDETRLPMGEVALAGGFGSVRRFNAGIQKVYHRTPTQLRRLARRPAVQPENHYSFHLNFRPPYNWPRLLEFLAARATPGVEAVERGCYRRTISLQGHEGYVEVRFDEPRNAVTVRVRFGDTRSLFSIIERIRAMFDLNADWAAIAKTLGADAALAGRLKAEEGIRVPGCWNGFELAVRAILGQQESVAAATTLAERFVKQFGKPFACSPGLTHHFPAPEILDGADLAGMGMPRARAETIHALARAVCAGQIRFDGVVNFDDFRARLCEIPGIGKWTTQYVAMRALRDPDAFPAGDLVFCRTLRDCTAGELERRSEAWRPWRAYAAMLLWQGRSETVGPQLVARASRVARRETGRPPRAAQARTSGGEQHAEA
ncbi:MAG TPA: AlkA N-terminal domain-containing protein [Candidatus Acidoferrales bacterium]|nr:AlkA N-terminal domain-containing protein [Candidatus Acidoferrales bacterium]